MWLAIGLTAAVLIQIAGLKPDLPSGQAVERTP
jgi:hypothetical protein